MDLILSSANNIFSSSFKYYWNWMFHAFISNFNMNKNSQFSIIPTQHNHQTFHVDQCHIMPHVLVMPACLTWRLTIELSKFLLHFPSTLITIIVVPVDVHHYLIPRNEFLIKSTVSDAFRLWNGCHGYIFTYTCYVMKSYKLVGMLHVLLWLLLNNQSYRSLIFWAELSMRPKLIKKDEIEVAMNSTHSIQTHVITEI